MTWYISDIARYKSEREEIETFAAHSDWLTFLGRHVDDQLRLILDADITVGDRTYPVYLRYPDMFPHTPPSIYPRGDSSRWSHHQFGAGGELCLEFGPDNWTPEMTGLQMLQSAHRLLSQEHPAVGDPAVVASRHAETLGQSLRNKYSRLLITTKLAALFDSIEPGIAVTASRSYCYHEKATAYLIVSATLPNGEKWSDPSVPKVLVAEARSLSATVFRLKENAAFPPTVNTIQFKAVCADMGFEATDFVVLLQGDEIRCHLLIDDDDPVFQPAVVRQPLEEQRSGSDHSVLPSRSVAIVGCGSLGSKVGTSLARAGVHRFLLVDDDILLPDNLVRHDLDWRDVGSHKADALARKIAFVNPSADALTWRARLGGQESSASAGSMIKLIGGCGLIIDATANPDILNLLSAIVGVSKKPLVWGEVFGGGIGGLVARCRPGIEPSPQHMRRAIENWFAERPGAPPTRSRRRYEDGQDGPPLIADDADVSVMAAHLARMAIDALIGREPSIFPNSAYAIGLGAGSIFTQPFEVFPIEVGYAPSDEAKVQLTEEELGEEVANIMAMFKARADEAAAAS